MPHESDTQWAKTQPKSLTLAVQVLTREMLWRNGTVFPNYCHRAAREEKPLWAGSNKRDNNTKSLLMAPHWSIVLFQRYRFTIDEKRRPLRASLCQYTYAHNAALTLASKIRQTTIAESTTPLHNPPSVLWKDLVQLQPSIWPHLRQHVLCIQSKVGVYLHALETCCIMRKYSPEQYELLRGRIILGK